MMNVRTILTSFAVVAAFAAPVAASASTAAPKTTPCKGLHGQKMHECAAKLKASSTESKTK